MADLKVAISMGSASDLEVMNEAVEILKKFGIAMDTLILSAHRTPEDMFAFAKSAKDNGYQVIIAGAGGAAHLPGMIASLTTLPVIGVPVQSKNSLQGWDSLLSIAQMPAGVPVATVAVNGAQNAGILAVQILAIQNPDLSQALEQYKEDLKAKVHQQRKNL